LKYINFDCFTPEGDVLEIYKFDCLKWKQL
jgi:hypothetical protein